MSANPTADWPSLLSAVLDGRDLSSEMTRWAMDEVMRGRAGAPHLAAFLAALRAKGVTAPEVEGLVEAMYLHAVPLDVPGAIVDIVGTGGDGAGTVNISTMAAIVAAGAGAKVVKHGNRAASSACGSADLLEQLGVVLELPPHRVAQVAEEAGITFCFAPLFHPAMRHAAPVRRELGIPTVFNLLGPLANPARPARQAIGVADSAAGPLIADVLARRGSTAVVFRGDDGLDELTVTTTSTVWAVHAGQVRQERLDPRDLGIELTEPAALRGADPAHNAAIARKLLAGEQGPIRDAVLLSAAATLAVAEGADATLPITERLAAGLPAAAASLDSGTAADVLDRWTSRTRAELATPPQAV